MKIGLKLPNSGPFATPEEIRAVAVEADKLGYDSVWVHDHIHRSVADAEHHFAIGAIEAFKPPILPNHYEAVATLLYLAGVTTRVALGTSVVVLPLRNPVVLAKETACLDQFSHGRLIFGAAVGGTPYAREELGAIGELRHMGKRGKVTDEWIDVMRGIWTEPVFNYEGQHIQVKDAEVYPKPVQKPSPPIWIGGFGEAAFKRAGERGDGLLGISFLPDDIRQARERIREVRIQSGRSPDDFQTGSEHWLSIDLNRERALERPAATMSSLAGYLQARQDATKRDSQRVGQVPERHFFGEPDEILEKLLRYREAGVDHMILRPIAHDFPGIIDALNLFKETVLERFREIDAKAAVAVLP